MTPTTTTDATATRVRAFADAVAAHFADLPARDRADLLEDLEQHLLELAAEDADAVERQLADPAGYAAELRAGAGLPEPGRRRPRRRARLAARIDEARATVAADAAWLRRQRGIREAVDFLPSLVPAWWVLRGWLPVALVGMVVVGGGVWPNLVVPGRSAPGLLLAAAAATTSVVLGTRAAAGRLDDPRLQGLVRTADLAAGVGVAVLLLEGLSGAPAVADDDLGASAESATVVEAPRLLTMPGGEPVTNLYVYDADGRLLDGVYVYDGIGQPVEVGPLAELGFDAIETVVPRDASGTPVHNRYPLEQYEVVERVADDGSLEVLRRAREAPDVDVPALGGFTVSVPSLHDALPRTTTPGPAAPGAGTGVPDRG